MGPTIIDVLGTENKRLPLVTRRASYSFYVDSHNVSAYDAHWVIQNICEHGPSANVVAERIQNTLTRYLSISFKANQHLLQSVYQSNSEEDRLEYIIVLREDTDEHRHTIFSLLDEPIVEQYVALVPVYFQFYPQHLEQYITDSRKIDL